MDTKKIDRLIANAKNRLKSLDTERNKVLAALKEFEHKKEQEFQTQRSNSLFSGASITEDSPSADKTALFRSLFKGREDVYARRWESIRKGKSGYQPACRNEWVKGLCRKPEIKCGECQARDLLPLTDAIIRNHLKGFDPDEMYRSEARRDYTVGIYPLLKYNKCWFLAVDFDKNEWITDVAAFQEICRRFKVPIVIERSRSGKGVHVWIFFSEPIPAVTARRLGTFLLSETLETRPEVGFDSYDRLFPSQDLVPEGGFGNLIALPLQGKMREKGNTLFLDDNFCPYPDQWAFLSSICQMNRSEVKSIVEKASRDGRIIGVPIPVTEGKDEEPWKLLPSMRKVEFPIMSPLPKKVKIVLSNLVYIEKEGLPPALRSRFIRLAAFQNPEFYKAQAMRFSTFGKPRVISCAEDFSKHIGLPRGCLESILEICNSLGIEINIKDERNPGIPNKVSFHGTLRLDQEAAVEAILKEDTGVLAAATAFGKTVAAAKLIAERGVNTLILVHRRQLLDQWLAQLAQFLELESGEIGQVGAGKRQPTGIIDIALIQSLWRKKRVDEMVGNYGHLIVDECHHISANSFEQVVRQCKAKYVTGLSATVTRKDGHHPIIFMQCGPVRYRVTARQGTAAHPFQHRVVFRETRLSLAKNIDDRKLKIHEVYDALVADESRNTLIFEDVMKYIAEENRSPLLITERREHLEMFAVRFRPFVRNVIVFLGGMGRNQRQALNEQMVRIPDSEERLLLATGRYLGEGFDDARLDTLFLTLPVSWRGTLAQYAGRLHRLHYNKKEVRIYDYVDSNVPMLARMHKKRMRGYRSIGYIIG